MGTSTSNIAELAARYAGWVDAILFFVLACVGVRTWLVQRRAAGLWFAAVSITITTVVVAGAVLGESDVAPRGGELIATKVLVAVLALFPYFLYRFMRSFLRTSRSVEYVTGLLTLVVVTWSLALPGFPGPEDDQPAWFVAYIAAFLAHWSVMSVIVAGHFWSASIRQVGVAARRMRLFAVASIAMTVTLLLAGATPQASEASLVTLVVQVLGVVATVLFYLAFVPPRWLRAIWRSRESAAFQTGLRGFLEATSVDAVTEHLLPFAARMVGARGALVLDADGELVGSSGLAKEEAEAAAAELQHGTGSPEVQAFDYEHGSIAVVIDPLTAFFGQDEIVVFETIASFASLAARRAYLYEQELRTNERLVQLDQLKNEFVAMVAHDIRSPMAVVSGFAETIRIQWDILTDDRKLELLALISRNTRSLAAFVEDVLQVARIEAGELEYEMRPFDAKQVAARTIEELRTVRREAEISMDAPDDLPFAYGDEERNWQIMTNLISNAIKFSPEDARIRVVLSADAEHGLIRCAVRDHGVGIAAEDVPKLFQKFSRIGANRRSIVGTGLGLYIVRSMVQAQGGTIWVDSAPGQGSTFTYTLPIAEGGVS